MKLCKLFFHLGDLMGCSINIGLPFNHNFMSLIFGDCCVDTDTLHAAKIFPHISKLDNCCSLKGLSFVSA